METVTRSVADRPETLFPVDLIRARARAAGHQEALVDERESLTYAALIDRVDALAGRLRAAGAEPQHPVAVLLERSADTVIAMLAALTAGVAYCPLDVTAPDARTAAMVARLGCRVAVADPAGAQRLPTGVTVVDPAGPPEAFQPTPVDPDALAYVMHTSGSTGVPKAVGMPHRGLSRLISWQLAGGETGLRTLQFTATSFDVTFQEVLSTLAGGGCLVVASEHVRRGPAALLDAIVRHRIQRLFLPYVALQLLAVEAGRRGVTPDSLRCVVTAGERLIVTPAIRDLFAAMPHCRLDNHYGPTEAHLVTSLTLPSDPTGWPEIPGIGTPVGGVVCRVLDGQLHDLSDGGVGELYVGGTGLAQGYLGDPAQTSERFIASPFDAGERLYRTGDLVRVAADGQYEFLGRADEQLKVRGFRVEPGEVEQALLHHPQIDAATVDLREVAEGVSVLVGYVQSHGAVTHRDITEHLRGLLPAYMVPARYVHVAALPRTATGKVDRRALAELELPAAPENTPVADTASLTDTITDIWARVLGHDEFAGDDDFFDVGGDSLLATWVVAELGQLLGRPVDLSLLLDYTTVDELADALGSTSAPRPRHQSSQVITLRPGPSGRGVYFVHPLGGELLGYRELAHASTAPARLLGIGWTGDPPEFGSTLTEIARTHVEQLRTVEPDGPYWLAGWSFGGVLAYEMAQQLRATGAGVEFLGLFDANPVIDPITGLPMAETPFLHMLDTVAARLDDPATTDAELVELTSGPTWLQLMGAPITAKASSAYLRKVLDTARACMNAAMRYEPRPYPGPVHLFDAAGAEPELRATLTAAMRHLCTGPLTVIPITGEHSTFIRGENVAEAAARLDAALERVGAEGSTQHGS
ncbi:amino acid adenylation domain-containing protein [Pseudonocardia xinjiangensis]|uniref:Amino acid adenylation domain-containing protein n=1 Tax=Pseudonocardia xinjiangensis TaxID=75289 RepID=A0ABX1R6X5_9PSEU|nr:amino acid adenylation domain-containing protein [Pseudonocardia xinjiangensis]